MGVKPVTIVALGLRIVIAVCAQILTYIEPEPEKPGEPGEATWPNFADWADELLDPDPPLEPWEQELLDAAKAKHPANYCIRCGNTHHQDGPCGRDN